LPLTLPLESNLLNPGGDLGPTILLPSLSNFGGSVNEVLDLRCTVDERVLCAERRATAALGSYHVPESECGEVRVVECGDVDTEAEKTHGILERL
jgi:hypothetical protein